MDYKNKVELIGHYGSDEIICLSAWTSTSRDLTPEKKERIPQLINQLWNAKPVPHGTPFEKATVHFLINVDIPTHYQILKHRMSSANFESARYKELKEDKYYLPEDWENIKLSSSACETISGIDDRRVFDVDVVYTDLQTWNNVLAAYAELGNRLYHQAIADLTPVLGRKRAKESARFFKPMNSQLEGDIMFNMRSFHNFITQRMDDHAQVEIQNVAKQMLELVKNIEGNPFKHTLAAWGYE